MTQTYVYTANYWLNLMNWQEKKLYCLLTINNWICCETNLWKKNLYIAEKVKFNKV